MSNSDTYLAISLFILIHQKFFLKVLIHFVGSGVDGLSGAMSLIHDLAVKLKVL
jgi:hypothetical protein